MKLNINFDKELEPIINSYEPLANWFERNQEVMAYFGLTHNDCLHFEDSIANYDVIALGRIANAVLTCLEENFGIDKKAHAMAATISLINTYKQEESKLSEIAKERYRVYGVEELSFDPTQISKDYQVDFSKELLDEIDKTTSNIDLPEDRINNLGKIYKLNKDNVIDDSNYELHLTDKEKRR